MSMQIWRTIVLLMLGILPASETTAQSVGGVIDPATGAIGPGGGGIHDIPSRGLSIDEATLGPEQCQNLLAVLPEMSETLQERFEQQRMACQEFDDSRSEPKARTDVESSNAVSR